MSACQLSLCALLYPPVIVVASRNLSGVLAILSFLRILLRPEVAYARRHEPVVVRVNYARESDGAVSSARHARRSYKNVHVRKQSRDVNR